MEILRPVEKSLVFINNLFRAYFVLDAFTKRVSSDPSSRRGEKRKAIAFVCLLPSPLLVVSCLLVLLGEYLNPT